MRGDLLLEDLQYTGSTRQIFQQNLENGLENSEESLFGAMFADGLGDDFRETAVIQDGDHGASLIQLLPVVPNELLHFLLET